MQFVDQSLKVFQCNTTRRKQKMIEIKLKVKWDMCRWNLSLGEVPVHVACLEVYFWYENENTRHQGLKLYKLSSLCSINTLLACILQQLECHKMAHLSRKRSMQWYSTFDSINHYPVNIRELLLTRKIMHSEPRLSSCLAEVTMSATEHLRSHIITYVFRSL